MVVASTFGNSFLVDLAVKLGDSSLVIKSADPTNNNWQGVIIITILAILAIAMMSFKYKVDMQRP